MPKVKTKVSAWSVSLPPTLQTPHPLTNSFRHFLNTYSVIACCYALEWPKWTPVLESLLGVFFPNGYLHCCLFFSYYKKMLQWPFLFIFYFIGILRSGIAGSWGITLWLLLDIAKLFSKIWEFPFTYILVNTFVLSDLKKFSNLVGVNYISFCSNLHFPDC